MGLTEGAAVCESADTKATETGEGCFFFFLVRLPSLTVEHSPEMILLGHDGTSLRFSFFLLKWGHYYLPTRTVKRIKKESML